MPSHFACTISREQAVIRSTSQLYSVDVIENRVDLVVLDVQDILAVEVGAMNEN